MDLIFESKSSFRKFQIAFVASATLVTCIFFILFQKLYSILDYKPPNLNKRNIDLIQTQFEFEDDKHLYLYDVPHFMDKSIIIAGMVQNVEDHIKPLLHSLNEIYCIFNNTIFIIFESNSNDNTPKILKQWSLNTSIEFCRKYKKNIHRKKNTRWKSHNREPSSPIIWFPMPENNHNLLIDSINKHNPSLVQKITIFNDTIVMNEFHKLQTLLKKNPNNGSINLNRIERYTVYRNMMLQQIQLIQNKYQQSPYNIEFDYLMLIDLDLFTLNTRMLFNELYYSPTDIICTNGVVHLFDMMYDIFAAVTEDGTWMHSLAFDGKKNKKPFKMSFFPSERYERMRSCFGGIAIYKSLSKLLKTDCKYQIIPSSSRQIYDLDDTNGYVMRNPSIELQQLADQYEIWMNSDERICEHLSFNYCLREHGYTVSIAKKALAYYSKKQVRIPMQNLRNRAKKKLVT